MYEFTLTRDRLMGVRKRAGQSLKREWMLLVRMVGRERVEDPFGLGSVEEEEREEKKRKKNLPLERHYFSPRWSDPHEVKDEPIPRVLPQGTTHHLPFAACTMEVGMGCPPVQTQSRQDVSIFLHVAVELEMEVYLGDVCRPVSAVDDPCQLLRAFF